MTLCHEINVSTSNSQYVNINAICDGIFFEARPFPDNRQFFVGCVRGVGIVLQCYENEFFDESSLRCVYRQTTHPPNFDGICDGKEFNFINHPFDCGKAIFCFQEEPIVRECPIGQIFDINTGRY